jgi:predicted nucleic acid-binding Zn ribbon protein
LVVVHKGSGWQQVDARADGTCAES